MTIKLPLAAAAAIVLAGASAMTSSARADQGERQSLER